MSGPSASKPSRTRVEQNRRPPRLSVLLAPEAPIGVVLRRGPTEHVRVVIWNRARDKFKPGQWFRGRIFADRSDVSPDSDFAFVQIKPFLLARCRQEYISHS